MKANDGSGNNASRDEWETPDWIFKPLAEQYGIGFDCCAVESNCKAPYPKKDFLDESNLDRYICWMNPPFSKAWIMFQHFFKIVVKGIAIYRCDNFETALWQKVIFPNATWVFIPDRRVSYEGLDGDGARFPSALIGRNVEPPKNIKGTLIRPEISAELPLNRAEPI